MPVVGVAAYPGRPPCAVVLRALIVAIAALVVATAGSAIAAKHDLIPSSSQIKPGAISLGNISAKARKAVKRQTGSPGAPGAPGMPGINGTARAYGRVINPPQPTRNKNVVTVTNPIAGEFCFTLAPGIDPATTGLLVSPDFSADSTGLNAQAVVQWRSAGTGCAAGTLDVRTYVETVTAGSLTLAVQNEGFFFAVALTIRPIGCTARLGRATSASTAQVHGWARPAG